MCIRDSSAFEGASFSSLEKDPSASPSAFSSAGATAALNANSDPRLGAIEEERDPDLDLAAAERDYGELAAWALGGAVVGLVAVVAFSGRATAKKKSNDAGAPGGGPGTRAAYARAPRDDDEDWGEAWGEDDANDGGENGWASAKAAEPPVTAEEWAAEEPAWSDDERASAQERDGWSD